MYVEIMTRDENTRMINRGHTIPGEQDLKKMIEKIVENDTGCKHDKNDHLAKLK